MAWSVHPPTLPSRVLGLLDYPEDEGITILRNFSKYLPNALVLARFCPRKLFYHLFHAAVIRGVHGQSILYTLLETEILKQLT